VVGLGVERDLAFAEKDSRVGIEDQFDPSGLILEEEADRDAGASERIVRWPDKAHAGQASYDVSHARAYVRASRPKPAKLAVHQRLRRQVEEDLRRRYSPEQIVGRLRRQFLTI
jgi:hypothetical protein